MTDTTAPHPQGPPSEPARAADGDDAPSRRILVVDDNPEIHELFRKMLLGVGAAPQPEPDLVALERELFDDAPVTPPPPSEPPRDAARYELESAFQGEQAVRMVAERRPYFLAFVDMRMPPGIDGLETIKRLWQRAPYLYTVICSAYSDHSWEDITRELGDAPNLLVLRKPFEAIEVRQIVAATARMYDVMANVSGALRALEAQLLEQTDAARAWKARYEAAVAGAQPTATAESANGRTAPETA